MKEPKKWHENLMESRSCLSLRGHFGEYGGDQNPKSSRPNLKTTRSTTEFVQRDSSVYEEDTETQSAGR
jgi:hypothetical protein